MLDGLARQIIDPPLDRLGRRAASAGIPADAVTMAGLALGMAGAALIAIDRSTLALAPILLSRLADGLDGAIARHAGASDFGGYLDISADFLFYGLVPFAFVVAAPGANAIPGAFVLASFYFNAASFLGFAILAERHGMSTEAQGKKSLYYSNGLLEGTETILFFVAICLLPAAFPALAWAFGALCFATAALRILAARRIFRHRKADTP